MKQYLRVCLTTLLTLGLFGCTAEAPVVEDVEMVTTPSEPPESEAAASEEVVSEETVASEEGTEILVVYFSATGTTEAVANTIAETLSADLYEIEPAEPYTDEDLNYNDRSTRATVEQNDSSSRPEIAGSVENWEDYDVVLIGYPIWWGEEPRIVDTFVESYDFTGKQVATFSTSGGSGHGNSGRNLESNAGSGTWFDGSRLASNITAEDAGAWFAQLGME